MFGALGGPFELTACRFGTLAGLVEVRNQQTYGAPCPHEKHKGHAVLLEGQGEARGGRSNQDEGH
jgi:hypothetical protein